MKSRANAKRIRVKQRLVRVMLEIAALDRDEYRRLLAEMHAACAKAGN